MKIRFFSALVLAALAVIGFSSCAKEGLGGDATLVVFLKHHGTIIPDHASWHDTVFVKYGADELPGTKPSDFDTYFVSEAGENHIHLSGLKWGKYFIYGAGLDSSGPYRVTGGMAVKIKRSDRKDEMDVDLAVTE